MLSRTNIVLAATLIVVVTLTAMSQVDYSQPNIEVLPDMKYTPAWTSFSANRNFPNGRTLQDPVAGTIARGALPLHYSPTKEDAIRAGSELINPYLKALDASADEHLESDTDPRDSQQQARKQNLEQSVQRGGELYRVYCVSCHGPTGLGDGPVPKRGFPPPPSLLTGASRQMKDGQLFHILTYGQGSMSSFAGQLSAAQRWDAINYVRSLQQAAPAPSQDQAPTENQQPGDPDAADKNASEETSEETSPADAQESAANKPPAGDGRRQATVTRA